MIVRYTREMKKKIRILQRSQGMGPKIYVEYLPKCRRRVGKKDIRKVTENLSFGETPEF